MVPLLEQLKAMRAREGEALEAILRGTLDRLAEATASVAELRPEIEQRYQERLAQRLAAAAGPEFNQQRVLEEVAVLVERSDISEELARMATHIEHFRELLSAGGEAGKKLDFLLQEMNREANTLLSKTGRRERERNAHHGTRAGHEGGDRESAGTDSERGVMQGPGNRERENKNAIEAVEREERYVAGILFIISAPSGSGKSTLVSELRKQVSGVDFAVSWTTRAPRGSEENGREYHFTTREEFERMVDDGLFLEYAEVFGNLYGTARQSLDEALAAGHDLMLDIDVQGAAQVRAKMHEAVSIFVLPPNPKVLRTRLRNRSRAEGVMNEGELYRRLGEASREIEKYRDYGYILVNDVLRPGGSATGSHCAGRTLLSQWRSHRVPFPPGVGGRRSLPAIELAGAA